MFLVLFMVVFFAVFAAFTCLFSSHFIIALSFISLLHNNILFIHVLILRFGVSQSAVTLQVFIKLEQYH